VLTWSLLEGSTHSLSVNDLCLEFRQAETLAWICTQGSYLFLKLGPGGEPASTAWRRQTHPWLSLSIHFIADLHAENASLGTSDQHLSVKSFAH